MTNKAILTAWALGAAPTWDVTDNQEGLVTYTLGDLDNPIAHIYVHSAKAYPPGSGLVRVILDIQGKNRIVCSSVADARTTARWAIFSQGSL